MGKRKDPKEPYGNTRDSEKGVEKKGARSDDREPAAGLIGDGKMVDPRLIAPR